MYYIPLTLTYIEYISKSYRYTICQTEDNTGATDNNIAIENGGKSPNPFIYI